MSGKKKFAKRSADLANALGREHAALGGLLDTLLLLPAWGQDHTAVAARGAYAEVEAQLEKAKAARQGTA